MDHHRRIAAPAPDEGEKLLDVLDVRRNVAVHRAGDVVHVQTQMIAGRYRVRQAHLVLDPEQGHDMARPGLLDRGVQARQ